MRRLSSVIGDLCQSGKPRKMLLSRANSPVPPLLRSTVVPWTDLRQPVDMIREELDARGAALLRQLR
jgi:hypothetical protein